MSAEVLGEEQGRSVECLVRLLERSDERLEHVRHPDGDVEDHVDIRLPRARGQPYGVIQEQHVVTVSPPPAESPANTIDAGSMPLSKRLRNAATQSSIAAGNGCSGASR